MIQERLMTLVDVQDRVLGFGSKALCHRGTGTLHRGVSVFLMAKDGSILLQQRSEQKELWPLYWSNSCCGHPDRGENYLAAAQRRTREELGVTPPLRHLFTFRYSAQYSAAGSENEICAVFAGELNHAAHPNRAEIAALRWITPSQLEKEISRYPESFTPWCRLEWRRIYNDKRDSVCLM